MNKATKKFEFKKGQEDWQTWVKVNNYICKYFSSKRRNEYTSTNLKTDYEIEVKIIKGKRKKIKRRRTSSVRIWR